VQARLKAWVLERLAAGSLALPVLPRAAQEAYLAASDARTDASRLAALIERDQSICAHLLRIANSPMYAQAQRISSVRQAVVRLGLTVVAEIAMSVALKSPAFCVPGWETELSTLFSHAFATGIFAKQIARLKGLNPEECFLAGLLHDLGRPVLFQALVDGAVSLEIEPPRELVAALVEELHSVVGRDLSLQWSLPPSVVHAIARHHDRRSVAPITMAVRLADQLAEHAFSGAPLEADDLVKSLDLHQEQIAALLMLSTPILETVRSVA
jgi:putative nucleotidyltransferase with HDIG domain